MNSSAMKKLIALRQQQEKECSPSKAQAHVPVGVSKQSPNQHSERGKGVGQEGTICIDDSDDEDRESCKRGGPGGIKSIFVHGLPVNSLRSPKQKLKQTIATPGSGGNSSRSVLLERSVNRPEPSPMDPRVASIEPCPICGKRSFQSQKDLKIHVQWCVEQLEGGDSPSGPVVAGSTKGITTHSRKPAEEHVDQRGSNDKSAVNTSNGGLRREISGREGCLVPCGGGIVGSAGSLDGADRASGGKGKRGGERGDESRGSRKRPATEKQLLGDRHPTQECAGVRESIALDADVAQQHGADWRMVEGKGKGEVRGEREGEGGGYLRDAASLQGDGGAGSKHACAGADDAVQQQQQSTDAPLSEGAGTAGVKKKKKLSLNKSPAKPVGGDGQALARDQNGRAPAHGAPQRTGGGHGHDGALAVEVDQKRRRTPMPPPGGEALHPAGAGTGAALRTTLLGDRDGRAAGWEESNQTCRSGPLSKAVVGLARPSCDRTRMLAMLGSGVVCVPLRERGEALYSGWLQGLAATCRQEGSECFPRSGEANLRSMTQSVSDLESQGGGGWAGWEDLGNAPLRPFPRL